MKKLFFLCCALFISSAIFPSSLEKNPYYEGATHIIQKYAENNDAKPLVLCFNQLFTRATKGEQSPSLTHDDLDLFHSVLKQHRTALSSLEYATLESFYKYQNSKASFLQKHKKVLALAATVLLLSGLYWKRNMLKQKATDFWYGKDPRPVAPRTPAPPAQDTSRDAAYAVFIAQGGNPTATQGSPTFLRWFKREENGAYDAYKATDGVGDKTSDGFKRFFAETWLVPGARAVPAPRPVAPAPTAPPAPDTSGDADFAARLAARTTPGLRRPTAPASRPPFTRALTPRSRAELRAALEQAEVAAALAASLAGVTAASGPVHQGNSDSDGDTGAGAGAVPDPSKASGSGGGSGEDFANPLGIPGVAVDLTAAADAARARAAAVTADTCTVEEDQIRRATFVSTLGFRQLTALELLAPPPADNRKLQRQHQRITESRTQLSGERNLLDQQIDDFSNHAGTIPSRTESDIELLMAAYKKHQKHFTELSEEFDDYREALDPLDPTTRADAFEGLTSREADTVKPDATTSAPSAAEQERRQKAEERAAAIEKRLKQAAEQSASEE